MEELIFFGIIILFSILDSIARTRKKRQQQGTGMPGRDAEPTNDWDWDDDEPSYDEVPSYDDEPSYDEIEIGRAPGRALPGYTQPYGASRPSESRAPSSSEGMIPADIWEEIAGLARERSPQPARAEPTPARQVEVEVIPPRPVQTHRVHRAHALYGTDPSSRPRSEQDGLDPLARRLSDDARKVRSQLRQGRHALRQAFILHEVLGPPMASRADRFEE